MDRRVDGGAGAGEVDTVAAVRMMVAAVKSNRERRGWKIMVDDSGGRARLLSVTVAPWRGFPDENAVFYWVICEDPQKGR